MSRYLNPELTCLKEYTPGEIPSGRDYIKLNTNESPFPPSPAAISSANGLEAGKNNLYPDPYYTELRGAIALNFGVKTQNVMVSNGSDEALAFAFRAFCGSGGAAFADVTYGLYPCLCGLFGIKSKVIPVREDLSINPADYFGIPRCVVIANPNAHTGLSLTGEEIEKIASSNKNRVVIIDEAYADFNSFRAVPLTAFHKNLAVISTFSKSRSLAGARLGFAIADAELISDLEKVRFSFNPYNISRLTAAMGIASLSDDEYFKKTVGEIIKTREVTKKALAEKGFEVTNSRGNFLLFKKPGMSGSEIQAKLWEAGVLTRVFPEDRIKDFVRVSIGKQEDMEKFLSALDLLK
ncbi:MAG: aminotransferase class I/II-fold pyridoxal phosphate-dependent enzyme [Eubacteriales bacterium]